MYWKHFENKLKEMKKRMIEQLSDWFFSSTGMSVVALCASVLVLVSTFLSSKYKDQEIQKKEGLFNTELSKKQAQIVALQTRIIKEIKAPHFEVRSGNLLTSGKLEINIKNISNVHFKTFLMFFNGEYKIIKPDGENTIIFEEKIESNELLTTGVKNFHNILAPSETRKDIVQLFSKTDINTLWKQYGDKAIVEYKLSSFVLVDGYTINFNEKLRHNGFPYFEIKAPISSFVVGAKGEFEETNTRPDLEYNPEKELPSDSLTHKKY